MHNVGPCNTCADGVCGVQSVGETGLLYARARYYDPASGQFISRDPVEGEARLPITWGAYQYCRYNPYRYVDPNGEQSTSTMMTTLQKDVAASPAPSTPWATATSAAVGGALGAGSVPLANAIKSSLDRRTVARALAKELQTTEPVLAAKTPSADVEAVLPKLNDATPKLVAEKDALVASPQTQPAVKTVQARRGEVNGSTSLVENNTVRILGAKGPNSGRNFEPENVGGIVRELNTNRVKVTERGIGVVEGHLARFGQDDSNNFIISRLKSISNGKMPAEQVDLNFYTHELREYVRYRMLGWEKGVPSSSDEAYRLWNNTHTATLKYYGLNEKMIPNPLYHKDAP
ncbi:MAG: RHS repeat-associated core domain-containing protein [Delftia sp.]|nr:RHS repeat-associated core domain-containing protein [Delftia sp.]MCP4016971.1 RHS repeat-associated core domain-containing protein [Delftia sp.]QPS73621.1 RHS repeat-associated core domain-containing protein [Delftia acidovorans]